MTGLYPEWLGGVLTAAVSNLRVMSGLDLSIFHSLLRGQGPAQNENSSAKSETAMQEPKAWAQVRRPGCLASAYDCARLFPPVRQARF